MAQRHALAASKAEAQYRESLLERKATDERNATRENARRRLMDRERVLSELRTRQAASGFANSGTPLNVFGEFRSRLDEEIDEATTQGLDRVANYREQIKMSKWQMDQKKAAAKMNMFGTIVQGVTSLASSYRSNQQQTGQDAFGIFN